MLTIDEARFERHLACDAQIKLVERQTPGDHT